MKANAFLLSNKEEVQEGARLGYSVAKEYDLKEFFFKISAISHAHLDKKGDIVAYIYGEPFTLKYDQELWIRICTYLTKESFY